jgi:hypothetical protein
MQDSNQTLADYYNNLEKRRRKEFNSMLVSLQRFFLGEQYEKQLNDICKKREYTLDFFLLQISHLREWREKIKSAQQAVVPNSLIIDFYEQNQIRILTQMIILLSYCQHTDYWAPNVEEILLTASDYLSQSALPPSCYDEFLSHRLIDLDKYDISPADLWRKELKQRFPDKRHIRQNRQYFDAVGKIARNSAYDAKMKLLRSTVTATKSFFGQRSDYSTPINKYKLVKFMGHFLAYLRPKNLPSIRYHLPDNHPVRLFEKKVKEGLCTEGYMTETTQFTDQAYLDPKKSPIAIKKIRYEIEGQSVYEIYPIGNDSGIYIATPTKLYFLFRFQLSRLNDRINGSFLICKESDRIQTILMKLKITTFDLVYILTPKDSQFFFDCFKHLRYNPEMISTGQRLSEDFAKSFDPYENLRYSLGHFSLANQRFLNQTCFEVFVVTSFFPLEALQLTQLMVNTLDENNPVACAAIGQSKFLLLRHLLTHTLEITAHKEKIRREALDNPHQYYFYTDDIDNSTVWKTIQSSCLGNYLWIHCSRGLHYITRVEANTTRQDVLTLFTADSTELTAMIPDLNSLKKEFQTTHKPVLIKDICPFYGIKLFNLAETIKNKFTTHPRHDVLIMHASVPGLGHTFYVVLKKENGKIKISIINGGSREITHHRSVETNIKNDLIGQYYYAHQPSFQFCLNKHSDKNLLTQYLFQLLALQDACHLKNEARVKPTYDQAIRNVYLINPKPEAHSMKFVGIGAHVNVVTCTSRKPDFSYPRQETGNCTVHNLINACIHALGFPTGLSSGFHPVNDVFKYALDQLINLFKAAPLADGAMVNPLNEGDAFDERLSPLANSIFHHSQKNRTELAKKGRALLIAAYS